MVQKGYVLYNTIKEQYCDNNGRWYVDLEDAVVFSEKGDAEKQISTFPNKDNWKVIKIKITYELEQ